MLVPGGFVFWFFRFDLYFNSNLEPKVYFLDLRTLMPKSSDASSTLNLRGLVKVNGCNKSTLGRTSQRLKKSTLEKSAPEKSMLV